MLRSDIEIMAPVGSYEALAAAIQAGADSVYFGIGQLNMRSASAANFTPDDLARIVAIAHEAGLKAYLTVNTVVYEEEIATVHEVIDRAKAEGVDAIIATDMAAILYARRIGQEVHISTQSNISNSEAVRFFAQWADTVVLARELTLEQVAAIHREIVENDIRGPRGELVEIEMFAHGALCMSISGKCYLSLYETNCSANRGACRQLCRRKYTVRDKETGKLVKDFTVLKVSDSLTLRGIPERAQEYVVNGKSALGWLVDRYKVTTDKKSGIVNDPNLYAPDNPRYIVDLVESVITVSLETLDIVDSLPPLNELPHPANWPTAWSMDVK